MNEVWLAAITQMSVVAVALIAAFVTLRSKQMETQDKVKELEIKVDGRLTELLKTTEALARAQGVVQGTTDERVRVSDEGRTSQPITPDVVVVNTPVVNVVPPPTEQV